ncbi:hypothetical protein Ddc_14760 [Ditylenchus destructor]|nr:hypothetical protein Ddc_14760 [Ditylenchus destructor]
MEFVSPSVEEVRRSLIPGTLRRFLKVKTTDANHNLSLYTHAGSRVFFRNFRTTGSVRDSWIRCSAIVM